MNKTDYAWVAGFLDGEGCFTVGVSREGRKHDPKIQVSQKSLIPILRLIEIIGGRYCVDNRGFYVYALSGATQIRQVLPEIIPYLTLKKKEAELLLDLCNTYRLPRTGSRVNSNLEINRRQRLTDKLKAAKR